MRQRILSFLAYTGAGLTLAVAVCVPFLLMGTFSRAVAHAGLHIDAAYSGGTVARTIDRGAYRILVYQPVHPRRLQRLDPFVEIAFTPASGLPSQVNEAIDLEGHGQPDVCIRFALPPDPHANPAGSVVALDSRYQSFTMPGAYSFSRLLVRTGNTIVVRVPLR